jgi:hypothetical protein
MGEWVVSTHKNQAWKLQVHPSLMIEKKQYLFDTSILLEISENA